jgi:hypothetical protein
MKPEDQAWRSLQAHASAQLRGGFADRVLSAAHGPAPTVWAQLFARGSAQLRPGFAERVLRAARQVPGLPSLLDQFAFSAATAAVCILTAVIVHTRATQLEDERNLAQWQQIAMQIEDIDTTR